MEASADMEDFGLRQRSSMLRCDLLHKFHEIVFGVLFSVILLLKLKNYVLYYFELL